MLSDRRLKKDVEPLRGALDRLLRLRGVTFEYADDDLARDRQIGLIAQEVERVFPGWVDETGEGYKHVTVRGLTALVVEALRELRQRAEAESSALRRELAALRSERDAELAALREEFAELGARLADLDAPRRHHASRPSAALAAAAPGSSAPRSPES